MNSLEIKLRLLTPAFLRGRDRSTPELRAPSFKGQLRWWYRAWNPLAWDLESPWAEGRVMGGTRQNEGQCPFLLRVRTEEKVVPIAWKDISGHADRGSSNAPGGLRYLGFSLGMPSENAERNKALSPGLRFRAIHVFRQDPGFEQARALLASWWLLAHLGGVGARSRRGFGSLVLESWTWPGQEETLEELPLPSQARDRDGWTGAMLEGLSALDCWRPAHRGWPAIASNLGPGSQVVLSPGKWREWKPAMEDAGRVLSAGRAEQRDRMAPVEPRVTFGLPLETGKAPKRSWKPGSFQLNPIDSSDRHASPLHLHIGGWKGGVSPCWALLAGPRPGLHPYRVVVCEHQGARQSIKALAHDAVGAFVSGLPGQRWGGAMTPSIFLHLDAQQQLRPADLPTAFPVAGARELRYREQEGPTIAFPADSARVDWEAAKQAVTRMADQGREASTILVAGRAPLPLFAWLGFQLQPWAGTRQVLANRRPDGAWDVLDLAQQGPPPFDDVHLGGSDRPGLVAVFASVMGSTPPEEAIAAWFRRQGLERAGTATVRTRARTTLDAGNGPGAAHQLKELLSQVPGRHPAQRGVVLFIAGPTSLAFMAGRAVNPNMFQELHVPNYAQGDYLPAVRHRASVRAWRWEVFIAHARPDAEVARRLFRLLDSAEHPVFLASVRLLPGDPWDEVLPQAQRDSRLTVVLVSGRTKAVWYEREEIASAVALARDQGHRVVPVFLPGTNRDDVPYGLRGLHALEVEDTADLEPVAARIRGTLDALDARGEP